MSQRPQTTADEARLLRWSNRLREACSWLAVLLFLSCVAEAVRYVR